MASPPSVARRQRRETRRREEILQAAAQVFAAKGYHAATTREIAEAADLAEGTLFNYFPSKRDMLLAVFRYSAQHMLGSAERIEREMPPEQALTARLEEVLNFYVEHRLFLQAILAEAWIDMDLLRSHGLPILQRTARHLEAYFRAQMDAGRLRSFDPMLAARLIMGMMAALLLPIVRGVQPPPDAAQRRRLAEGVVNLFLHGLAAEG